MEERSFQKDAINYCFKTIWEFISFNKPDNTCSIEGYILLQDEKDLSSIQPIIIEGKKLLPCKLINRPEKQQEAVKYNDGFVLCFQAEIPLTARLTRIQMGAMCHDRVLTCKEYGFGRFFPLTDTYDNSYAKTNGYLIKHLYGSIVVRPMPNSLKMVHLECRLLCELWRKNILGGRKAIIGRLFYHFFKPLKRREIWTISDRVLSADDNGEALFIYLMKNKPKNVKVFFLISNKSEDNNRLKRIGKCINIMSFRHKLLHLLSDVTISSQADVMANPFIGRDGALRDLLCHQHFVFLQHGVITQNLSVWLNRYKQNMSGFVTSASPEYWSIINGDYHYRKDNVWLTGLPRFDRLYRDEAKKVTLMPTWRKYLMDGIDLETHKWKPIEEFTKTTFYRFYNGLLNSERLIQALTDRGFSLQFFPHPNLQPCIDLFQRDSRVFYYPPNTSYRDVYAQSNLIITDYSSAVFDFAYLRKPIIYCQFDKDEFFSGNHTSTQGYFDFERDGFGEVTYDLESTVDQIIEYVEHGCQLKDKYRERIDRFFAFNDQNNCKRVVEKLLALPDKT